MAENTVQQVVRHLNSQHIAPLSVFDNISDNIYQFTNNVHAHDRSQFKAPVVKRFLKAHVAPMFRNHQDLLQICQQKKKKKKTQNCLDI